MWTLATKEVSDLGKKMQDLTRSVRYFEQAAAVEQGDGRTHFNLGQSLVEMAELFEEAGQLQQACAHCEQGQLNFSVFLLLLC